MGNTTIQLQSLHLRYFKSFRDFKINFKNDVTTIEGDNGTGKTTISDAFFWLFFGKDTNDNSDTKFSIKTIDAATEKIIDRVDHSVEAVLLINGERTTAKRELIEKWTKKKGASEKVYSGNVTKYYWNEVPLTQRDYMSKINHFISEEVFKLITDPYKFNSMHWEKMREVLTRLVDNVSNQKVAEGNKSFQDLLGKLTNKTFDEYKKQMKHTLKKLKEDKEGIPMRIDEQKRGMPESEDFDAIEAEIESKKKLLEVVDDKISDKNKTAQNLHDEYDKLRKEKTSLDLSNDNIYSEVQRKVNESLAENENPVEKLSKGIKAAEDDLNKYSRAVKNIEAEISSDKAKLEKVEKQKQEKSQEWDKENAADINFEEGDFACPTCKRPLEAEDEEKEKEKMKTDFIEDKKTALASINKEGLALKNQADSLQLSIKENKKRLEKGNAEIEKSKTVKAKLEKSLAQAKEEVQTTPDKKEMIKDSLRKNKEYIDNQTRILEIEEQLQNQEGVDVKSLKEDRDGLLEKISDLKKSLDDKYKIESINKRVTELMTEEKQNSQLVADAERELNTIQEFEITKMNLTEESINSKFDKVTFKMFNELVDGTQVPDCICHYQGVPFQDVNTAWQIVAGLDIINTLCDHYSTQAVIFIDGAESITDIPETKSQQIRLQVKKGVKSLSIK
jgi:DNA repair exonuclease SbcCD ATPase subunit